jgi:hypothetical protein
MGSFYERQDTANNISNGNVINADDLDAEFNALQDAFNGSTGHSHDGTTGEGGPITVVGPAQDVIVSTNLVRPKTTNVIDLGSPTFKFKDAYVDGIMYADGITFNGGTITATAAEINHLSGITSSVQTQLNAKQPLDAELTALAGLTSAADRLPYFTGLGTATLATFTAFGRSLVDDADATAARSTLGVVIGTNVQAYDAALQSISGLTTAANQMIYTTAADTYATTSLTAFGRSLVDDADAAAGRTTLGLGTLATQDSNSVNITGGSISVATIATSGNATLGDAAADVVTINGTASFPNGDVAIGGAAVSSAELTVTSTDKGFLGPRLTTTQRDAIVTPVAGLLIYNTTLGFYQVYNGTSWTSVGGGATGGGTDQIFYENGQTVTANYTITNGRNAMSAGPITINSGVTVTVGDGEVWTIV